MPEDNSSRPESNSEQPSTNPDHMLETNNEHPSPHLGQSSPAQTATLPLTQPDASGAQISSVQTPPVNSPGIIILQWLTYAFWGWTVLALSFLTAISVSYFVRAEDYSGDYGSSVAYPLAAVIVLFVISFICDMIYSRFEPARKHGAAMVVMVIHAVIFALFGIGALIAAVFAVVNMLIGDSSDGNYGAKTTLITGLIIALVYAATLLRTVRLFKLKNATKIYGGFMAVVAIVVTSLAIAGPTMYERQTRDDRLIESGLPEVARAVRDYSDTNDKLPSTLTDVESSLENDGRTIVDKGLVEYTPGDKVISNFSAGSSSRIISPDSNPTYKYKLCVTYKAKKGSSYEDSYRSPEGDVTPSTYTHKAGKVCYNLVTDYSY